MLLAGYTAALGRFTAAARGGDDVATFLPLFEALNWALRSMSAAPRTGRRRASRSVGSSGSAFSARK